MNDDVCAQALFGCDCLVGAMIDERPRNTEWQVLKTLNNRRSVVHAISGKSEIWCTDERRIS